MVEERSELLLLPFALRLAVRVPALVTRAPVPVSGACFASSRSPRPPPLAPPTPLPVARLCSSASQHYGEVRLLTIVHHRLRLLASPMRTSAAPVFLLLVNRETSRFPYKERPHMPRSSTTLGRAGTRVGAPVRVAFRNAKSVGARYEVIFAAQ